MYIGNLRNHKKFESDILIKFSEEKHVDSLALGNIYTNNFNYFIELEKQSKIKGIGDKDEQALEIVGINIKNIERIDNIETDIDKQIFDKSIKEIFKGAKGKLRFESSEYDKKTPMFCTMRISKNELLEKKGLIFSKEEIQSLKKDFEKYTHALIIDENNFKERMYKCCKNNNIDVIMDCVRYSNSKINELEKIKDFNTYKRAFWKDDSFEKQKEFRVVFMSERINEGKNLINIGDLSDVSLKIRKEDIFNERFKLELNEV
ncbi:hypothetical protein KGF45_10355 [Clostridioides sp. ZZV14-6154]|uniref:hypothetical protein n=1 Tax=Clostridioides sp. ZZV14-6154 TaxID=2811495 RepID=UPI001D1178B4|nr:hypothetical protein [Clostridioides sp. ZZV14-6154]